jgi:nucleoid-associated protein YgaU
MAAYYIKIKGKNYDKKLIDQAKSLISGKGDGRLSLNDAKAVLKSVKDSDNYTDIEKITISYIRDNFKFTKESDAWFRTEIRRWAALKSTSRKKTEPKKSVIKKAAVKKTVAVKKAPVVKKAAVKKTVAFKKVAVIKKAAVKKTVAVKKAPVVKKAAVKKTVAVKKAPVVKKAAVKKTVAVKKAPVVKKAAVKKTVAVKKAPVVKKAAVKKTVAVKKAPVVKKAAVKKTVSKAPVKKVSPAVPVKKEPTRDFMAEIIRQGTAETPKIKSEPKKSSFLKAVWVIIILLIAAMGVYLFFPNIISTISSKIKSSTQSTKQIAVENKQIKKVEEKKQETIKPVIEEKIKQEPVKKEIIPAKKVEPKQEDLTGYYIVKEKDSLIDIAKKEYGDFNKWKEIYDLNAKDIVKPSLIYIGQKLKMPKK